MESPPALPWRRDDDDRFFFFLFSLLSSSPSSWNASHTSTPNAMPTMMAISTPTPACAAAAASNAMASAISTTTSTPTMPSAELSTDMAEAAKKVIEPLVSYGASAAASAAKPLTDAADREVEKIKTSAKHALMYVGGGIGVLVALRLAYKYSGQTAS